MAKPEKYWVDMTNKRYGMLTALERVSHRGSLKYWRFKCDCGAIKIIDGDTVRRGRSRSCGCQHGANWKKHGMCTTRTYSIWAGMHERCKYPKNKSYFRYGGAGIKVCKRWGKFENFFADMGECPPGLTIERLDSKNDYKPSNCRWATMKEQQNNRSNNRWVIYKGEKMTVTAVADLEEIPRSSLNWYVRKKCLPIEEAINATKNRIRRK